MPDDPNDNPDPGFDEEPEPMEVEQPRRAASAQFEVRSGFGAEAALREAMDPANQSLADALRLSYKVLQGVMVVLVVLFLVSGFQRVSETQSGVMLRFGRIVAVDGERALEPGLRRNLLPSPAGEFVIFDVENRPANVAGAFWPETAEGRTLEQAIDQASVDGALRPGRTGYLVTRDADFGHIRISAEYDIVDPVRFVETVREPDARRIVELALQRAAVIVAAGSSLQEIVDAPDDARQRIRVSAARVLDALDCGIELANVRLDDARPPFAIVKAYRELQQAREESRRLVEEARQHADEDLIRAAGPDHPALAELIDRYEEAEDLADQAAAERLLGEIDLFLEERARGELSQIIQRATAYESAVELTLGSEARRFAGALAEYRDNPEFAMKRRWQSAVSSVLGRKDLELVMVPEGMPLKIKVAGLEEVQKIRRDLRLRRNKQRQEAQGAQVYDPNRRAQDYNLDKANPILDVEGGRIKPRGSER